jgi:ubiquinone/menaquinone biosynthesis C-methylase UbiE
MTGKREEEILKRFTDRYSLGTSSALNAVEKKAIGAVVGANGYTTIAQAEKLLEALDLRQASWLLDVGAGKGWPGLYLSERSECHAVVTDIPRPAVSAARSRGEELGLAGRCHFALASGSALPFRNASFDAIVHTDTL